MKRWIQPVGAALFLLLIILYPADALLSACEAFSLWALSVAPALLPFLIITPALICPETTALFSRISAGVMHLMRCSEEAAGAVLVGLLGGSPAGAAALRRLPRTEHEPPGALLRTSLLASGASPAFLLGSIATGMLNAPEAGWLLLRSQLMAVLATGLLLRSYGSRSSSSVHPSADIEQRGAALSAALTLLTIAVYMAFFSVLARLLARMLGTNWEAPLIAVMELGAGCRALSLLPWPMAMRLPLISAAASFGGLSVCMQCLSFLRPLGVCAREYILGKLLQALLAGLFTLLQLRLSSFDPLLVALSIAAALLLMVMLRTLCSWKKPDPLLSQTEKRPRSTV